MRYHFHIRSERGLFPDDEGMEFDKEDTARAEALKSTLELAREFPHNGGTIKLLSVDVVEQTGRLVLSLPIYPGADSMVATLPAH
jgi:hypothetical protein